MPEGVSPQRILEQSISLLETMAATGEYTDDVFEEIDNNVTELKDLVKRLYMAGIYSI